MSTVAPADANKRKDPLTNLRHVYFTQRHGHSVPNERGIICSAMENGVKPEFGLSSRGVKEVEAAGEALAQHVRLTFKDRPVLVVTSPFTRARMTADATVAQLARSHISLVQPAARVDVDLRERFFGDKELQSDTLYPAFWERDAEDATLNTFRSESPAQVWNRVLWLVRQLETELAQPSVVVLVAHGDVLQISETAFRSLPLTKHRTVPHMRQAEWRNVSAVSGVGGGSVAAEKPGARKSKL